PASAKPAPGQPNGRAAAEDRGRAAPDTTSRETDMPLDEFRSAYDLSFWSGLPLRKFEVPLTGLRDALPDFELRSFGAPPDDNPRMRMIVRMPHDDDMQLRPVAAVSDRYDLLQHRVVASWLASNVQELGLTDARAKVVMTEYGERIRITIPLDDRSCDLSAKSRKQAVDVGDIYQPEIEVLNSVDRSSALHVSIRWRRLVCLNGMFTVDEDRMRSVHHVDLSRTQFVKDFIEQRLSVKPDVLAQLQDWKGRQVTKDKVQAWCEDHLRAKGIWPVNDCARLWAILETGYDGAVQPPTKRGERLPLWSYGVGQHMRVPGVPYPIETAYDLAQLLTWITSNQRTVQMQIEGTEAVPKLVESFLAS
ncbi:MAG: DUF932 domain-containing protein, partial [Pararhodobacter sp.]|nr:DUF932 domain-containing protein [Pararhodobacter sp.]